MCLQPADVYEMVLRTAADQPLTAAAVERRDPHENPFGSRMHPCIRFRGLRAERILNVISDGGWPSQMACHKGNILGLTEEPGGHHREPRSAVPEVI